MILDFNVTDGATPDGDTHFGNAMQLAEASITNFKEQTAIIFLTDGQARNNTASNDKLDKDADRENIIASERLIRLDSKCRSFTFYPIKFGAGTWKNFFFGNALQRMAKAVNTNVINVDTDVQGNSKRTDALKTVNLTEHFQTIATKIGDTSLLVLDQD